MERTQALDLLLYWLSEHRTRSEVSFSEGCRALGLEPSGDVLENLARLGHVERVGTMVMIVPPTVIWVEPSEESGGLLYGARTEGFREQLEECGVAVHVDPVDVAGPSVWSVSGNRDEIEAALAHLPVRFGVDRFDEVLVSLPALCQVVETFPVCEESVLGRNWRRFVPGSEESSVAAEDLLEIVGFYRSDEKPSKYVFRSTDRLVREVRSRELRCVSRWAVVARESSDVVLTHDGSRRRLKVPWVGARLPLVLDRGLRACTAKGPIFASQGNAWQYDEVSVTRARQLARIVGLRLIKGEVA